MKLLLRFVVVIARIIGALALISGLIALFSSVLGKPDEGMGRGASFIFGIAHLVRAVLFIGVGEAIHKLLHTHSSPQPLRGKPG